MGTTTRLAPFSCLVPFVALVLGCGSESETSVNTSPDPDPIPDPDSLTYSDEFDSNTLSLWSLRHQVEGTEAQYTTLDIGSETPGSLTIVPTRTPGWFADGDGPLVFKLVEGDFSVHTRVQAESLTNPGQPPSSNFNSAGLMARDPAGGSGPENYVMLNVGTQDGRIPGGVGSEGKTTVDSNSELFLDAGSGGGELVLCRIGDEFLLFRFLPSDGGWILGHTFRRPDLPSTLQVGMVVNAFEAPPDLRATFDFIRLRPTPATADDCTP